MQLDPLIVAENDLFELLAPVSEVPGALTPQDFPWGGRCEGVVGAGPLCFDADFPLHVRLCASPLQTSIMTACLLTLNFIYPFYEL